MIAPMLSKDTDHLPSGKDFLYEIKLDGQRTIAEISRSGYTGQTRAGTADTILRHVHSAERVLAKG